MNDELQDFGNLENRGKHTKMKHPFQIVLTNKSGALLFTATQSHIQVFSTENGERVGEWTDDIDTTESIKEKIKKEQQRQKEQKELEQKESGSDSAAEPLKKKRKSNNSEPKVPTPGPGAPKVYNYIRTLILSNNEKYLIGTTDSDKSGVIFELDLNNEENILKLLKRQPFPKRPSAISTSKDDSSLVLGDKFGDVYSTTIDTQEAREINSEAEPILGHVSMLTDVTMGSHDDKEYIFTADRDEHIRISNFPKSYVIKHWLFGHQQFVSALTIPSWNPDLLISGGGDDYIFLWDWFKDSNQLLDKLNIREIVEPYLNESHFAPSKFQNETGDLKETCVSKILALPDNSFAVLIESTKVIVFLKYDEESKKLSLDKILQLDSVIISITASDDKLFAAVESEDDLLRVVDLNTKELLPNSESITKISTNSKVDISSKDELYPLYTVYQLRKRSEH